MKQNKLLVLLIFNLFTITLLSQTIITGKVIAEEDDFPLAGVNILAKGTSVGTVTNFDGMYTVKVPKGTETLIFSYVGYGTQEIGINEQAVINCTLLSASNNLQEIVLIGYGAAKKTEITGAISTMDNTALENRPVARLEQALTGQMAGVRVRATTGDLGASLEISIRGKTSVSADNSPLYVVDGFPTDDIADLVASDIASISVLKDAAQAAIYGSRGANGVVLIETKKGKSGEAKFRYNAYFGVQTVERKIDMLSADEWIDINKEVINKSWVRLGESRGENYQATDSYDFRLAELNGLNTKYMSDPRWDTGEGLTYLDWQDEMFRSAQIQQHQITASGGSDNVNYYVSATYFNQEGIVQYTDYNRLNFRSNLNVKFNDKLSMSLSLSPTTSTNSGGRVTGKDAQVHYAVSMSPITEEGVGIETGVNPNATYQWASSTTSPVAYLRELHLKDKILSIRSNLSLNYKVLPGLTAKVDGAYYGSSRTNHRYIPTKIVSKNTNVAEGSLSSVNLSTWRDNKYLAQGTLSYSKNFGKHGVSAVVGSSIESRWSDRTYQKHNQVNNDVLVTFNETTSSVVNSYYQITEDRLLSNFGRVSYNFDDRYLLSGSIRRDGSSRLGENNLWGTFPSFSTGWRIDKEAFMEKADALSMLKFRYGFGKTGNNRIPLYSAFGNVLSSNYSFSNTVAFGNAISSIENTDLGWEITLSSNFGIDIGVLKNRFFLSFDYYDKRTSDMLYNAPVPLTSGFSSGFRNIGSMRNKGYDIELNTKNLQGNFKWRTSLNFSHNENEVESLVEENTPIFTGFQNKTQIIQVGKALNSYYMYDAIGVYMNQDEVDNSPSRTNTIPGDVKYRDVSGDGIIDEDDLTIVGNPEPDFYWGITNTFSYKFLELSVLLQGQQGGVVYGLLGRAIDNTTGAVTHNRPSHWKNRWRSETDTGDGVTPRIDGTTAGLYDSRWLYDATYWKVKNVTLTAKLPDHFIKGITNSKVYFSADNLFMQDDYAIGFSPEAVNTDGGDYGGYPLSSVFTIGLNLQF